MDINKIFFLLGVLVTIGLTAYSALHIFLAICCGIGRYGIHIFVFAGGIYFLYKWRDEVEKILKG